MKARTIPVYHGIVLALLVLLAVFHQFVATYTVVVTRAFTSNFGWLIVLSCSVFVGICLFIACSRYGRVRLGADDEQPAYTTRSWLAMVFAAGMGTGLVFYGAAEPLIHYLQPPPGDGFASGDAARVRRALAVTYFHWGVHAWAIYALAGLGIAYFSFRHQKPMLPSAAITRHRSFAVGINTLAMLAVIFGIVATLSQGVLQLATGIQQYWPVAPVDQQTINLLLIGALTCAYMASASTGLRHGIRQISIINMGLACGLLGFILLAGATTFVLNMFVTSIGGYFDNFLRLSFDMRPFSDTDGWLSTWTIPYLLWWIAWAPFVGVFIARISRGRTIRAFIMAVVLVPTLFSMIWFSVLGGSVLHHVLQAAGSNHIFMDVLAMPQRAVFLLLETLPFPGITVLITLVLLFLFIVTSADSGTYVLAMFARQGMHTPPVTERLFWGLVLGVMTLVATLTGKGTEFFRSMAAMGGVAYFFIMIVQVICLLRALDRDAA